MSSSSFNVAAARRPRPVKGPTAAEPSSRRRAIVPGSESRSPSRHCPGGGSSSRDEGQIEAGLLGLLRVFVRACVCVSAYARTCGCGHMRAQGRMHTRGSRPEGGGYAAKRAGGGQSIRAMLSESWHPSDIIRVTLSEESRYPSDIIRVTGSEQHYPSHGIRATLSESRYPSHSIRGVSRHPSDVIRVTVSKSRCRIRRSAAADASLHNLNIFVFILLQYGILLYAQC